MKHPAKRLTLQLDQALELVNQPSLFSFSAEERQVFRTEADKLRQNLDDLKGGYLVIGLIGGTGVGKSSLMNALAGAEIASTSHRRPHTDQVLIYRHEAMNQALELSLGDVPWREITHQAEAIQQILLCDLPDFDSLMGEHRERVLEFLEYLDVVVWVTSPEKYADKVAYEFLELVPKAGQNFYFVLNKADIFSGETNGVDYEELGRVTKSYQNLIRDHGV
ncbi:MAG: 50S ribosome-binding GTPase, partial [Deltaproteobacteria bacterium]|nr:50S ribosome-binding GTPase [Deltaproteobacteria bacterium]